MKNPRRFGNFVVMGSRVWLLAGRVRPADSDLVITGTTKRRGMKITFKPDTHVFETIEFSFDTLANRLRELAFLNGGVRPYDFRGTSNTADIARAVIERL